MSQDSIAYYHDYGQAQIEALGNHFGNPLWVLKSHPESTNHNGYIVKPVLINPLLEKDALMGEFTAAWGVYS